MLGYPGPPPHPTPPHPLWARLGLPLREGGGALIAIIT